MKVFEMAFCAFKQVPKGLNGSIKAIFFVIVEQNKKITSKTLQLTPQKKMFSLHNVVF